MKSVHVNTKNTARLLTGVAELRDRGAQEACILVVDGPPGLGKTTEVEWWAVQNSACFVRAKTMWTEAWMLREILETMNASPAPSYEKMFQQALEALSARAGVAEAEGTTYAVVVDEIDHIMRRPKMINTLRDLSDFLEIPFLFVGVEKVGSALARQAATASRIGRTVEFRPADVDDVRGHVKGLCEVPVEDDLVAYLHRVSHGYVREVKEGIKSIERFGLRNRGKAVTRKDMVGQVLLNDRKTGKPIMVREDD